MHWQKCYFLWIPGNLAFPLGDTYRIVFEWVAISPNPQFFYERTGTTWIGLELEGWWLAIAKRYKRNFVWGGCLAAQPITLLGPPWAATYGTRCRRYRR